MGCEVRRAGVIVEAASAWSNRNDVRIPPGTGTEFSITDLIGIGPDGTVRLEASVELAERHGLRFAFAPLRVRGSGVPDTPILFAGGSFTALPTEAEYQFDSYRVTYRYRVHNGETWRWKIGFTGFVRDARIALTQPGTNAQDTDVGFVPLGHVSGEARLSARWGLRLELDGAAAPQGRASDVLAAVEYKPSPRWTLSGGYRTIEGGADVDEVFTFAWPNVLIGTARVGRRPHTQSMSHEETAKSVSDVQSGDVLVSHPTAVREHDISIVPNAPHATSPSHDAAVNDARSEADATGVDAWLTEDQTHVVKIASNRTPDK